MGTTYDTDDVSQYPSNGEGTGWDVRHEARDIAKENAELRDALTGLVEFVEAGGTDYRRAAAPARALLGRQEGATSPALNRPCRSPERVALETAVKALRWIDFNSDDRESIMAASAIERIETLVPTAKEWR